MAVIANRKGIILMAHENGTYSVEDNDLNETFFHNVVEATHFWSALVIQE